MSGYEPGDIVDITIKGARVTNVYPQRDHTKSLTVEREVLVVSLGGTESVVGFNITNPAITVERTAPPEWPPKAGDLWRDKHGELWFIHARPYGPYDPPTPLMGRTTGGARWTDNAAQLIDDNAPLTLVHREGGAE